MDSLGINFGYLLVTIFNLFIVVVASASIVIFVLRLFRSASRGKDPVQAMKQLKEMLDSRLITREEYEAKKTEILSRM